MKPNICPECKFANKRTSTTCTNCGTEFSIPNCFYHPDKKSTTICPLCQNFICAMDTKEYLGKRKRTGCEEVFILQYFLFALCFASTKQPAICCVNCYEK